MENNENNTQKLNSQNSNMHCLDYYMGVSTFADSSTDGNVAAQSTVVLIEQDTNQENPEVIPGGKL